MIGGQRLHAHVHMSCAPTPHLGEFRLKVSLHSMSYGDDIVRKNIACLASSAPSAQYLPASF